MNAMTFAPTSSSIAPLHAYGGFVVEHHKAGGCDVWSFDGSWVFRASARPWTRGCIGSDLRDGRGRPVLFLSHSAAAAERVEVRSGSGRRLGAMQERSSHETRRIEIEDGRGRAILEVNPIHLTPSDFAIARLPPRRARRVATVQRTWDERSEERVLYRVTYESRTLDADERALVLAVATSMR